MRSVEVLDSGIVYENTAPHLHSRQAFFPSATVLPNGEILAVFVLGEASDSVDQTSVLSRSRDRGRTWEYEGPVYDKGQLGRLTCDFLKISSLPDGRILAIGDRFERTDPDTPSGNPESDGQVPNEVILLESVDGGLTWTPPRTIPTSFRGPTETTCPVVALSNGHWVTPVGNFPDWEGRCETGLHGRLLRSEDEGKTWSDSTVTMEFPGRVITAWEQRLCETGQGRLVVIGWNVKLNTGRRLPNHYCLSGDYGRSFSPPCSTGTMGEASSVHYLGNGKVAALQCLRKGAERPGIYLSIVDLSAGEWNTVHEAIPWEPASPIRPLAHGPRVFSHLKFGQPSLVALEGEEYLMVHWATEDGQSRILWNKLAIEA